MLIRDRMKKVEQRRVRTVGEDKVWQSLGVVGEAPIFRVRERTVVRDRLRTN